MVKAVPPAARATPPLLKHLNERTVLEAIRSGAPISRAEISRRAGISKPTVSLALQSLVGDGLVREAATAPGGPSYGAVFFEPVPEAAYISGVVLGPDDQPTTRRAIVQVKEGNSWGGRLASTRADEHGKFRLRLWQGAAVNLHALVWASTSATVLEGGEISNVAAGTSDVVIHMHAME